MSLCQVILQSQTNRVLGRRLVADGERRPASAAGICRSRHRAPMGLVVVMVTAIVFPFPLFKTSPDRVLGLPCLYSGLKEKEQLVFALCLMKSGKKKPESNWRSKKQTKKASAECSYWVGRGRGGEAF